MTHNIMNCWCRTFAAISKNINHHPSLIFPGHYNQSLHTFSTQSSSWLMTETTPTKKSYIVQLKDLGHTNHDVAEKENINPSTVSCIYGQHKNFMRRSISQVAHTNWMTMTCILPYESFPMDQHRMQWTSNRRNFQMSALICCDGSLKGMAWMHI